MPKTLIFFATYNEAGNVGPLLTDIAAHAADADVLVVDDNSKDGTVEAIQALGMPRVTILQRKGKLGLGTAHLLALAYAIHHRYEVVVTMDGDLSHDPAHLPALLGRVQAGADMAVGSRYMPGGSCDYTGYRLNISRAANVAARALLGIRMHEFTTSYRAFRVSALSRANFTSLLVGGYSFFLSMVVEASERGFVLAETPIHFRERGYGTSKIPPLEVFRGMANLLRLALKKALGRVRAARASHFAACPQCRTPYSLIVPADRSVPTCVYCGSHNA
ncbi:MAG TPA: glycosyltransferase [Luteibacter sp.]|jgi:glycosyltransferase involved in cell wall biosynthesis|uniref:glycosyltransferase n=1 Tax=Luteibacter sp. TaxID=1886636 RepID=UPI002F427CCE